MEDTPSIVDMEEAASWLARRLEHLQSLQAGFQPEESATTQFLSFLSSPEPRALYCTTSSDGLLLLTDQPPSLASCDQLMYFVKAPGLLNANITAQRLSRSIQVLKEAKSSYMQPFLELSSLIQHAATSAEDNLRFMVTLEEPCKELAAAQPEQIVTILPRVLCCVRFIWNFSRFYNTPECITRLLRKISNELINRCREAIHLQGIFTTDALLMIGTLKQCTAAGDGWRALYDETAELVLVQSPQPWDLDVSPIFAHVEAFVQRCMDLQNICEAQLQFGPHSKAPNLGGTRCEVITQSIDDIKVSFGKLLSKLALCDYNVLDISVMRWHDDFNLFKLSVKDLEELLIKATDNAVAIVADLKDHIHLIEGLQVLPLLFSEHNRAFSFSFQYPGRLTFKLSLPVRDNCVPTTRCIG